MIYFDNASTSMLHPLLDDNFFKALREHHANPSANHQKGLDTYNTIESLREKIARELNVKSKEIYFTSGATESNNLFLNNHLKNNRKTRILCSPTEHASIRETLKHESEIKVIDYFEDLNDITPSFIQENTSLFTAIRTNNEVGHYYKLNHNLIKTLKEKNILIFEDCVQAFLKEKLDLSELDGASFSAHKVGAFSGLGMLYMKENIKKHSLMYGGSQESSFRPGTPNLEAILSLDYILDDWIKNREEYARNVSLIKKFIVASLPPEWVVLSPEQSSPYILSISFPSVPSEVMQSFFNEREIYLSSGSSCSSHSKKKNHTVSTLFNDESIVTGSLRISFSPWNNMKDAKEFMIALKEITIEMKGLFLS